MASFQITLNCVYNSNSDIAKTHSATFATPEALKQRETKSDLNGTLHRIKYMYIAAKMTLHRRNCPLLRIFYMSQTY